MEHFICIGGCNEVSESPGICEDVKCLNNGMDFEECHCGDVDNHDPEKTDDDDHIPDFDNED